MLMIEATAPSAATIHPSATSRVLPSEEQTAAPENPATHPRENRGGNHRRGRREHVERRHL